MLVAQSVVAKVVHWAETMDILTAEKSAARWAEHWAALWVETMVEMMDAYSVVHWVDSKVA